MPVKIVRPKGRKPPPPEETPNERFNRLAQARMVNALHSVRLLGNLSTQGYNWDDRQIIHMRNQLSEAIEIAFTRFARGSHVPKLEDQFSITAPVGEEEFA